MEYEGGYTDRGMFYSDRYYVGGIVFDGIREYQGEGCFGYWPMQTIYTGSYSTKFEYGDWHDYNSIAESVIDMSGSILELSVKNGDYFDKNAVVLSWEPRTEIEVFRMDNISYVVNSLGIFGPDCGKLYDHPTKGRQFTYYIVDKKSGETSQYYVVNLNMPDVDGSTSFETE